MCLLALVISVSMPASGEGRATIPAVVRDLIPAAAAGHTVIAIRVAGASRAPRRLFDMRGRVGQTIAVAFAAWLIVEGHAAAARSGQGRRIVLVDTGFSVRQSRGRLAQAWGIGDYRSIDAGLGAAGFAVDQVTDVVISHRHWDHGGGLQHFTGARVWITAAAMRAVAAGRSASARRLARALTRVEVRIVHGPQRLTASVALVPVGLHTSGFQYVVLRNPPGAGGYWVIASDLVPLRDNIEKMAVTGQTSSPRQTLRIMRSFANLVDGRLAQVVPGHDPGVFATADVVTLTGP